MKKNRKKFARLGRVAPASSIVQNSKLWNVKADAKSIHFEQLWARKEDKVTVPISDVLDFGLNRTIVSGTREFRIGLSTTGLHLREAGSPRDIIITFPDLLSLIQGQTILPIAS